MKKIFSLIFSLMLLLLGSCTKDEVLMTASISGYVTDYVNANAPIAGATVTINTKGITKTTGSDGRYEFTDVEPGTYTLQVTANGYQATTKQTTVYAGEVTNLDFQLSPAGQNVEVTPQMLSFGPQSKSLNFSIKNKGNASLQYSITNYPSYITVSPASGSVSAKGTQTVTVNVNRDALTDDATCQLLVNIGNDSYPVNISINSQEVTQKLTVTPALLDFGTAYNELQFTVKNIGTAGDLAWNISAPTESSIQVSPSSGTTAMGNSTQITVKLDRSKLISDLQTFLNVNVPGGSVSVQIIASKANGGETGGNEGSSDEIAVKANLLAYYTFDEANMKDDYEYGMDGQLYNDPTFIDDTPNGKGKALFLNAIKDQYVRIPYQPFKDRKAYSISFWIKDLGAGTIFGNMSTTGNTYGPAFFATESYAFKYLGDSSTSSYYSYVNFTYKYTTLQDGLWHMVTITKDTNRSVNLYVDGQKVDTGILYYDDTNGGVNMKFGGMSSMKLDNIRFYAANLSLEEIREIYNSER